MKKLMLLVVLLAGMVLVQGGGGKVISYIAANRLNKGVRWGGIEPPSFRIETQKSVKQAVTEQSITNLEIQSGWTWEAMRISENYSYIRGRVKNTGETVISYFEVAAVYKDDAGNVLDTDYTNSGETLRPGWSKEFEIMHKVNSLYTNVAIRVQNISIER